tara:strand:- start:1306 stop:1728 length:423 start_codon:yes stop_codon:yes gene_type:complete
LGNRLALRGWCCCGRGDCGRGNGWGNGCGRSLVEVQRASGGARGELKPIMREGLKITHARTCAKAGLVDFRFHDFRHTAATRLLRATGNLRLVQLLLGHGDIKTTMRYAHASGNDLLNAMNATESATEAANRGGDEKASY